MNKRILIVDDDIEILDMLKLTIEMWCPNCQVILATNGLDALVQLQLRDEVEKPFDLILTDYEMPLMNGLDLAHEVRQNWPDVRIVMMTGQPEPMRFQNGRENRPIDGYLQKPFILEQVQEIFRLDSGILH